MLNHALSGELIAAQSAIGAAKAAIRRAIEAKGFEVASARVELQHDGRWYVSATTKNGTPFEWSMSMENCGYCYADTLRDAVSGLMEKIEGVDPLNAAAAWFDVAQLAGQAA